MAFVIHAVEKRDPRAVRRPGGRHAISNASQAAAIGFMTRTGKPESSCRLNAIRFSSGDHTGSSARNPVANRASPVPSAFAT
jgi:hypothetical protein